MHNEASGRYVYISAALNNTDDIRDIHFLAESCDSHSVKTVTFRNLEFNQFSLSMGKRIDFKCCRHV